MALITDPDLLILNTEITIDTTARTFTLVLTGNLSTDGVTLRALYSFFKERWKNNATLIPFPFPMIAITPEQFEFVSGWKPANDATRKLIRSGGWAEISAAGVTNREYLGVITLGNIDPGDRAYYVFAGQSSKTDFTYTGPVNEAIQTYGDLTNGNFNYRTAVLTVYIRVQGKTFAQISTTDIGVTDITYKVERFPLSESTDLKITVADATISTTAPYTGMSITYYATPQARSMGTPSYNFGVIINANGGTAAQVYQYIKYQLRQNTDINAGASSIIGLLASDMAVFVGDRLDTLSVVNPDGGGTGVFISNLSSLSVNDVRYIDNTPTYRTFPFIAGGTITLSQTLADDPNAIYRLFFTTNPAGNYGTATAVTVNDATPAAISGNVTGRTSIAFTFDYDGNVQGGRTAGTDASVTLVAIGLQNAQYASTTATISRSTSNVISLTSPLERNYSNPV